MGENTTETRHVTIGPEFFAKAPLDYSNPSFALVREFVQNGVDAPKAKVISVKIGGGIMIVANDGEPMSEDVLLNVFLALGGTTKGGGQVGGFGKAKELLCFCHDSYKIETGGLSVFGVGASYRVTKGGHYPGTRTTIKYNPGVFTNLEDSVRLLASSMNWKGTFMLNGEVLPTAFDAKVRRTIDGLGKVKVVKGGSSLVVRAGGVPMFISNCPEGTTVILDMVGDTKALLTSNRDGLRYQHSLALADFVKALTTNKRKALHSATTEFFEYGDTAISVSNEPAAKPVPVSAHYEPVSQAALRVESNVQNVEHRHSVPAVASRNEASVMKAPESGMGFRFCIRNETGMKLDKSYFPDTFGKRSKRLIDEWVKALVTVHSALDISGSFGVGFIFSEECAALYEMRSGTKTYYVSPVSVDRVGAFRTMRSKKLDRYDLLAFATHEVLHGQGYSYHDESFASALTFAMAKVLRHSKKGAK